MTPIEKITRLFVNKNIHTAKTHPLAEHYKSFDWIRNHSGRPWIQLTQNIPAEKILKEIKQCQNFFVPHRDSYNEHRGWYSFCIHGQSLTQTQHSDNTTEYHWISEVEQAMPFTVSFFRTWPGVKYRRLRVMALEPGGYIALHRDLSRNKMPGLEPVNIAINNPENCKFVMKDWGCVPFEPGTAFMLDVSNYHAVFNNSNQTRYHIIAHCAEYSNEFKHNIEQSWLKNL